MNESNEYDPIHEVTPEEQPQSAPEPETDDFASAKDAWNRGAERARETARNVSDKAKKFVGKAVRVVSYDVAWSAHFAGALLTEFLPETVKQAGAEGAEAGRQAGKSFADGCRNQAKPAEEHPSSDEAAPVM